MLDTPEAQEGEEQCCQNILIHLGTYMILLQPTWEPQYSMHLKPMLLFPTFIFPLRKDISPTGALSGHHPSEVMLAHWKYIMLPVQPKFRGILFTSFIAWQVVNYIIAVKKPKNLGTFSQMVRQLNNGFHRQLECTGRLGSGIPSGKHQIFELCLEIEQKSTFCCIPSVCL